MKFAPARPPARLFVFLCAAARHRAKSWASGSECNWWFDGSDKSSVPGRTKEFHSFLGKTFARSSYEAMAMTHGQGQEEVDNSGDVGWPRRLQNMYRLGTRYTQVHKRMFHIADALGVHSLGRQFAAASVDTATFAATGVSSGNRNPSAYLEDSSVLKYHIQHYSMKKAMKGMSRGNFIQDIIAPMLPAGMMDEVYS